MRNAKNKIFFAAITTLVLLVAAFGTCVTTTKAQQQYLNMQEGGSIPLPPGVTPDYTVRTEARLSFRPNPVGIGQPVLVNAWLAPPPHVSRYFSNFTIVITKPDGTKEVTVKKSYRGDATTWFEFTPDRTGKWTIEFMRALGRC
jgi:hypothetical protein